MRCVFYNASDRYGKAGFYGRDGCGEATAPVSAGGRTDGADVDAVDLHGSASRRMTSLRQETGMTSMAAHP